MLCCASTSLQRGQAWPRWREVDAQHSMMMGVVDTRNMLEWTWRIINRLLCVASRWIIINISIIYSECVCSLGYPACNCSCPVLSSVACPTVLIFCTLSHKQHGFRGGGSCWTQSVCFYFLYKFCVKIYLILRRILRNTVINVHRHSC